MGTLLLIVWLGATVLLMWPMTSYVAHDINSDEPDSADYVMGGFLAVIFCPLWPLALLPLASWLFWRRFLSPTNNVKENEDV